MKSILKLVGQAYRKAISFFRACYNYGAEEDLPEQLRKRFVYVLGSNNDPWALAFMCPCGCNEVIQLNLLKEAKPKWEYEINSAGNITIRPSIWRRTGCKSHFFIKNGRIIWA
jgi:hypothetical protein